jgi:hypothetical protein
MASEKLLAIPPHEELVRALTRPLDRRGRLWVLVPLLAALLIAVLAGVLVRTVLAP